MPKLSFVLPVFNVEKYLRECVESIKVQMNEEIELILVNDGSTDSSGSICDELSVKDERIRVIHKKNGGLASARNAGLRQALGDYIGFIDSDDRVSEGCIDTILETIEHTDFDICFMKGIKFFPDGRTEDLGDAIEASMIVGNRKDIVLRYLASRPKYSGSSCTKIYKRDFLLKNRIEFPEDRRQSEDLGFVRDCIILANKYYALDCPYYEYRQNREGSITYGASKRAVDGILCFIKETIEKYSENNSAKQPYGSIALSFSAYEYFIALLNYALMTHTKEKEELLFELSRLKWVTRYTYSRKNKILKFMIDCFGVKISSSILSFYYRSSSR